MRVLKLLFGFIVAMSMVACVTASGMFFMLFVFSWGVHPEYLKTSGLFFAGFFFFYVLLCILQAMGLDESPS